MARRHRQVSATVLTRLWREVLTRALGATYIRKYCLREDYGRIRLTTLRFLAIKHRVELPSSTGKLAEWAIPPACGRYWARRVAPVRPALDEPCPQGRCTTCDTRPLQMSVKVAP